MSKEKMLSEIGVPSAMSGRPPAAIVPQLPKDLEQEIYKLVNWLHTAIAHATSTTGPGQNARNLPWLSGGVRGFFRNLWYGKHPENPNYKSGLTDESQYVPLKVRKLTLKEYKELEAILDHCLRESLICEFATPSVTEILQQFWGRLKQLVMKHVVKNGTVKPSPPPDPKDDEGSGDDVRPVEPEEKEETSLLEPKDANEEQARDDLMKGAATNEDQWRKLVRKIIEELPEVKKALKDEMPENFSDFRDAIEEAMDDTYKPSPILAMCFRKPELQQKVYELLQANWERLSREEEDTTDDDLSDVPQDLLNSLDTEEKAALIHTRSMDTDEKIKLVQEEIKKYAKEIVDLAGRDQRTMLDTLAALILTKDSRALKLPPNVRLIVKSMKNRGIGDDLRKVFADMVEEGLKEEE